MHAPSTGCVFYPSDVSPPYIYIYFLSLRVTVVPPGPGLGPVPMSQFGTISRQISRHSSSSASSSASMVSATGTYRRAPSSSSQFSVPQSHLNGGPTYPQNPAPGEYLSGDKLESPNYTGCLFTDVILIY